MEERLEKVPGLYGLYYDKDTKIVYYVVRNLISSSWCITAMTPFLGKNNGHPCYYDEKRNKIKEF